MRSQSGFSMVTLLITLALSIAITVVIVNKLHGKEVQGEFKQNVNTALSIAQAINQYQYQVQTSTQNASGVYQYTFNGRTTTFTPVSTFNSIASTTLPVNTTYGTPFSYIANGYYPQVEFTVTQPANGQVVYPNFVSTSPVAGGTNVVVTMANPPTRFFDLSLMWSKNYMYQEFAQ